MAQSGNSLQRGSSGSSIAPDHRAISLITHICRLAGSVSLLNDIERDLRTRRIDMAIQQRDTPALFDWLMESFSFQGISDRVARNYIATHGSARWHDAKTSLQIDTGCPLLKSYWTYDGCGYVKSAGCCSEPDHLGGCPVPVLRLRNGRLNQIAYSLFLFVRDVAGDDLVSWIDERLALIEPAADRTTYLRHAQEALVGPLRQVFGLSDKILTMSLSVLLIGGGRSEHPRWGEVGTAMIAVDSLVHNFLHRSGILGRHDVAHVYGPGCYQDGGCADILRQISAAIDARQFNRAFPANFPRFVQHAIWQFCAQDGKNVCNGNSVDDRLPCANRYCQVSRLCDHITLKPAKIS